MVGFFGVHQVEQDDGDDNSDSEWERITESMRSHGGELSRVTANECRCKFNELMHQYKLFRALLQLPRARYDAAAHAVFLDDQDWDRVLASCAGGEDAAFYREMRAGGSFAHVDICSKIEADGVARAAAAPASHPRSKRRPLPHP